MRNLAYMHWNEINCAVNASFEEVLGPLKTSFSSCTRRRSKFHSLLGQRLHLPHPNLGCCLCWDIAATTNQMFQRQHPLTCLSMGRFPVGAEISPKYVRARITIRLIKTQDIFDVCSSLDLGLYVDQEGRRNAPQHWNKFKFGILREGRRRLGLIIIVPGQVRIGSVPNGIVLRVLLTGYINKSSFRGDDRVLAVPVRKQSRQRDEKINTFHFLCVLEVLV